MAITTNQITAVELNQGEHSSRYGFAATKSDANYAEDPRVADRPFVARAFSIDVSEDVKVEFPNGETATIPAGILATGIQHPISIVKVFSTGTGGSVVVWLWE